MKWSTKVDLSEVLIFLSEVKLGGSEIFGNEVFQN